MEVSIVTQRVSHLADRNIHGLAIAGARPQPLASCGHVHAPDQRHGVLGAGNAAEVWLHRGLPVGRARRLRPLAQNPRQYFRRPAAIVARRPEHLGHHGRRQIHDAALRSRARIIQSPENLRRLIAVDRPRYGLIAPDSPCRAA